MDTLKFQIVIMKNIFFNPYFDLRQEMSKKAFIMSGTDTITAY